ncbi:MAG TPA: hypothetical protein VN048_08480 [Verrucomicrobiae bacterium]|jgi:hypothetical protein|nr:hypothetical protein [Verrucomicrobiae bacterium]
MKTKFTALCLSLLAVGTAVAQTSDSLLQYDYRNLVAHADLSFDTPAPSRHDGLPIGNGRMGTLVWTTPAALHYQINHDDLFCFGNNTLASPNGHTDYSSGCGYVDINLVDFGNDVFAGGKFSQRLSVYEGLETATGNGVQTRSLAWTDGDVIATEVDDQRSHPGAINIDLRMLRYAQNFTVKPSPSPLGPHGAQIRTGDHVAISRLDIRDGKILLTQEFTEGEFYSASAIAIGVMGREAKASYYNELTVRLSAEPHRGRMLILTASAVSYDRNENVGDLALKQLAAAQGKSFDRLLQDNRTWWGNFWAEGFIHLHSADGVADNVEKYYTYFLYLMGSCSRATYMPRFCGVLWGTDGDLREWGSMYWWHNQGSLFDGFTPANRSELMTCVFNTYSRHLDTYARAAQQQWGSQGIWIPETTWFNGLEDLPDNIAAEMRDLYLARKPWSERSKEFDEYARDKNGLNSRWNYRYTATQQGPFAWTSHVLSTTAKIANLYWLHYAYWPDPEWLRTNGYPVIRGTAEFYRNFPNLYKADDGKYHIRHVNNLEEQPWGSSDTPEELLAMRVMFPIAIRASEILNVDADLRQKWKEISDNLLPVPPAPQPGEYYDICTPVTDDTTLFNSLKASYTGAGSRKGGDGGNLGILSREPVIAANLGMGELIKTVVPGQMHSTPENDAPAAGGDRGQFRNRMVMGEGPGAIEFEQLGNASHGLQNALLQSVPPSAEKEPVNTVFPAWPKGWDAQFTLAARGAFLISASMQNDRIEFVEILSEKGGQCILQNPWPAGDVTVYRNGQAAEGVSGKLLTLSATAGERLALVPKGQVPAAKTLQ